MYVHMRFEESPTKSVVVYLVTVGGAVGINLLASHETALLLN